MTEGGQEFAVKRAARETGQLETRDEVITQIRSSAVMDEKAAKKQEVGAKLLTNIRTKQPKEGAPEGAPGGTEMVVSGGGRSSRPGSAGSSKSHRIMPVAAPAAPGAAPRMAEELRSMSAKARAEGAGVSEAGPSGS